MKVLVIDSNKCNGCYNCQIGCKDEHAGNVGDIKLYKKT